MTKIAVDKILPNPDQPRTVFDEDELLGLAKSIEENDLIQPIVVERAGDQYILLDGERRWRAVKMLGWRDIEAVIRECSNHHGAERVTQALVANVQRSNLGPVDEARVYKRLMKPLRTVQAVADKVGVSNATVSSRLFLLDFPEPVQKVFNLGRVPIDLSLLARLKKLPAQQQTDVITAGAARGWTAQFFKMAIARALKKTGRKYQPLQRTQKEIQVEGHFDALALVEDWKDLPATIISVSRRTCQACPLYAEASRTICKQCPLPDFLGKLNQEKIS